MKLTKWNQVNGGHTVAFFTVEFSNGLQINDLRLVQGSNGLFVSPPQRAYEGQNGRRYVNIVWFPDDLKARIQEMAIARYEAGGAPPEGDIPF